MRALAIPGAIVLSVATSVASADVGVSRYQRLTPFLESLEAPLFECFDDVQGPQAIDAWPSLFIEGIDGTNRDGDHVAQLVYGAADVEFSPLVGAEPPSAPNILSNDPSEDARFATGRIRFDFALPMNAIGFFVADGSTRGAFFLELFDGDDLVARVVSNGGRQLPDSFFGVVSSLPFDAAEFGTLVGGDSWGLDDLYVQPAEPCRADLDVDGDVDITDLLRLLTLWGPCPGCHCRPDLDRNGLVDFTDLCQLLAAWGSCG